MKTNSWLNRSVVLVLSVGISMVFGMTVFASGAKETASTATKGPVRFGISIYNRDQFFSSQETAMKKAAADVGGVEITAFDAQQDVQKQLEHVTTFATQNFDAIAVSLVDPNTVGRIISIAKGIPLIFQNRMPDISTFVKGKDTYIGSDENESGKMQGEWLANYFKDSGKKSLDVVFIKGDLGLDNTTKRTASAKKALQDAGYTLNIVFEDTANWDRATALTKMEQVLGTGKHIDAVITNNDEMALGAIEALKAVSRLKDIPVLGIDATAVGVASVKAGEMSMTVYQNAAAQGQKAVELAKLAATGAALDPVYWIPFVAVTKDNVDSFMHQ